MQHAAALNPGGDSDDIIVFTDALRQCMHTAMVEGNGTRDLCGVAGLTAEEFVDHIANQLSHQKQTIERKGSPAISYIP